jgi:hypothetical protein
VAAKCDEVDAVSSGVFVAYSMGSAHAYVTIPGPVVKHDLQAIPAPLVDARGVEFFTRFYRRTHGSQSCRLKRSITVLSLPGVQVKSSNNSRTATAESCD